MFVIPNVTAFIKDGENGEAFVEFLDNDNKKATFKVSSVSFDKPVLSVKISQEINPQSLLEAEKNVEGEMETSLKKFILDQCQYQKDTYKGEGTGFDDSFLAWVIHLEQDANNPQNELLINLGSACCRYMRIIDMRKNKPTHFLKRKNTGKTQKKQKKTNIN